MSGSADHLVTRVHELEDQLKTKQEDLRIACEQRDEWSATAHDRGSVIDALEKEIEGLKFQLEESESNQKLLLHDCAFWRRATEQAVTGWDALEDKIDEVVQKLRAAVEAELDAPCITEALEILVELSPLEPPTTPLPQHATGTIDLGEGVKLTVVEDETPIKKG